MEPQGSTLVVVQHVERGQDIEWADPETRGHSKNGFIPLSFLKHFSRDCILFARILYPFGYCPYLMTPRADPTSACNCSYSLPIVRRCISCLSVVLDNGTASSSTPVSQHENKLSGEWRQSPKRRRNRTWHRHFVNCAK